jgi:hypothetical protein
MSQPWPRDSNETASDQSGAVHGLAKAHAPARIQPVPERSRSPKRITKEHRGSNPLSSTRKSARTARVMQEALFYGFSLERRVPDNRLLRKIDRFVDLSEVRAHLGPYYSDVGGPH